MLNVLSFRLLISVASLVVGVVMPASFHLAPNRFDLFLVGLGVVFCKLGFFNALILSDGILGLGNRFEERVKILVVGRRHRALVLVQIWRGTMGFDDGL
ncbi:hypothetical protein F4679DRAFT_561707 [Xylaria curta]|nr:hypothetical protein F4679DRAFT_561707 [Xylaria curta]